MDFDTFLSKVTLLKTKKLGGLEAQFRLAPKLRLLYNADKIRASNPKKAAVLALFYPNKKGETCFLLTKRASYKGTHSAQISFPGGKIDSSDNSLQETALRETFEEVGIGSSAIKIIRKTTDAYIQPSNFLVTPFFGFTQEQPIFITNHEVDTVIEVLLSDLLDNQSITTMNITTSYMKNSNVPCFKLNNYIVWGATAMMLNEIKELIL